MTAKTQIRVPLLDLRRQFAQIRSEVLEEITKVADSQQFILGAGLESFEEEIARYCGTRHAIGCASGSDALVLALMAVDVKAGDRVLTTPYSFFATAGAISRIGAIPVFADIELATYNLDPVLAAKALQADPGIKAVIPVHLYGGCADLDPLIEAAQGIPVIEDSAQSIGAEYRGRRTGGLGTVACFSFFPTKNLGAFGDAGLLTTDDESLATRLKSLRVHGSRVKYYHDEVGFNSRMDALQAAVLRVKLRYLDNWTTGRGRNAALYTKLFRDCRTPVIPPVPAAYQTRHVWNQYVIRCQNRDALRAYLVQEGIGSEVYYPVPLHLQECFRTLGYKPGDFPISEQLAAESLALPVYPELKAEEIEAVVDAITHFYC